MLDSQPDKSPPARSRNRGFSFAEVMFAVVILGIGFIMVAAIFPVAIQQTQGSSDDSASASVAREASNAISALPQTTLNGTSNAIVAGFPATFPLLPPTVKNFVSGPSSIPPPAVMVPFVGPRFDAIKSSLILPSNPRLAYIPFYMRDNNSSVAQMVVVAVAAQTESTYEAKDISPVYVSPPGVNINPSTFPPAPTSPTTVAPATIAVTGGPSWLSEGCFVNVAETTVLTAQSGRTYLLGRQIQGVPVPTFEMLPGDGLSEATGKIVAGVSTDDGLWNTQDDQVDTAAPAAIAAATTTLNFPSTLQPTTAYAKFSFPSESSSGRITLSASLASALAAATSPTTNAVPLSAASGAFIIVSDDAPYMTAGTATNYTQPNTAVSAMYPVDANGHVPRLNGRIFRLGAAIAADNNNPPGTYELDPAFGLSDVTAAVKTQYLSPMTVVSSTTADTVGGTGLTYANDLWARVYIAGGRTLSNTADPTQPYTGPAQAIAAYSTFIPVK